MSSSAPMTPATDEEGAGARSRTGSSPPSSPPSEVSREKREEDSQRDAGTGGVSKTMRDEEKKMEQASRRAEQDRRAQLQADREKDLKDGDEAVDRKFRQLQVLLDKSNIYAKIMYDQMKAEQDKAAKAAEAAVRAEEKQDAKAKEPQESTRKSSRAVTNNKADAPAEKEVPKKKGGGKKMPTRSKQPQTNGSTMMDFFKRKEIEERAGNTSVTAALAEAADDFDATPTTFGAQNLRSARQPDLVSGGIMRGYQLEGLEWLTSLYENGLNGILADEMGLGKTIQTISFLAFLRSKRVFGPFLIAAPLSTLSNWVNEFNRWTPEIPVLCYHGTPAERAELRRKRMVRPDGEQFPVICTSYEISMNDKKHLSKFGWKYIVIDEGHRLKNYNCKLIRDLKMYNSSNRLLITGTPLQNNLRELWSLLSFVMPDIFNEWETFESWFDFSALDKDNADEQILVGERKNNIVGSLHAILKPFLLRRVKADVESDLPAKREYVLYAPLTAEQKDLYDAIFTNQSRAYLENKAVERITASRSGTSTPMSGRSASLKRKAEQGDGATPPNKSAKSSRASTPATASVRKNGNKGRKRKDYREKSDREYFKGLEEHADSSDQDEGQTDVSEEEQGEIERAKTLALARKEVSNKKLQNPVMQMRLACNSPHNFYYPWDNSDTESAPADYSALVTASGKMLLLDQLIPYLFSRNHKILLFSQFKTQLDLLEDWAVHTHGWPTCRIDGGVAQSERQAQIHAFDTSARHKLFLLSTRAGGQGINLAAADTVILFDSDWNPQQDLQAQDRAHRIGQTKPVVVYRLATRGTVEQKLLEKADGKRKLERLVIRKGKFRSLLEGGGGDGDGDGDNDDAPKKGRRGKGGAEDLDEEDDDEDLKNFLKRDEIDDDDDDDAGLKQGAGSKKNKMLLSKRDLEILTDRSDEAYERAEKGLDAGRGFRVVEGAQGQK